MPLKRKASFSSEVLHGRSFDTQPMADVPHHLNSRTRKRVRDNRPDQQTVYANTLRMLFQAQKEPIISSPPNDHSPPVESSPSEPEALDPRQQTLLKFFRPTPASSSTKHVNTRHPNNDRDIAAVDAQPAQCDPIEVEYDQSSSISGSSTPYSAAAMDLHMTMDVDMDQNTNYLPGKQWKDGISWI